MLHRTTAIALAATLLVGCAGEANDESQEAADAVVAVASDDQAIEDVRAYWETHYNMHHADMVASTYADSAWSLPADGGALMGRAAIEADLVDGMAASPTASITSRDLVLMGDMAVGMGTYAVTAAPEGGESMNWSGTYLNVMTKASGEWKILGSITNFDAARPEGWPWNAPMAEAPAEEGTMTEVTDYYATHWNMGHASMVADLYTDDAISSFSNGPIYEGRAAIEAATAERIESGAKLTIHDVATMPLGEGWAADGGWYQLDGPDGTPVQTGAYMTILKQQEDGSWKIHRSLTNGQPAPAM
jgi:uncharacterized protein (TIGR02246 family)